MTRLITAFLIAATTTFLVIWDIVVVLNDVKGDTISETLNRWASDFFILPLVFGVIAGHLFWPQKDRIENRIEKIVAMSMIGLIAAVLDLFLSFQLFPVIPLIVGIIMGHYLWPQRAK